MYGQEWHQRHQKWIKEMNILNRIAIVGITVMLAIVVLLLVLAAGALCDNCFAAEVEIADSVAIQLTMAADSTVTLKLGTQTFRVAYFALDVRIPGLEQTVVQYVIEYGTDQQGKRIIRIREPRNVLQDVTTQFLTPKPPVEPKKE